MRLPSSLLPILVVLLAGCATRNRDGERFQGSWEVASVERNGTADPKQIGSRLTFAGNEVRFDAKVAEIADGTR